MLNIATTAVSTAIILNRMNDLEQAIKILAQELLNQFAEDRQVKMDAAIHAAHNAFSMEGAGNKDFMANTAILELFKARQHIWLEIDTLKGSSRYAQNNELMQNNVEQACAWIRFTVEYAGA